MDIYTQVPDKATRDALKRLSDLFDDHQAGDAGRWGDELEAVARGGGQVAVEVEISHWGQKTKNGSIRQVPRSWGL